MISDFVGTVLENKKLNETVFETSFGLDKPMIWEAGQYVSIEIPNSKFQNPIRRSYSICSMPDDQTHVSICVDTKPGGPGSVFIQNLKPGDRLNLKGPLGKFTLDSNRYPLTANFVFVATGTGIGPFKAMIPTLLNKFEIRNSKFEITLLWGLRHKSEAYYQDFFDNLKSDKFNYQIIFSEDGKHVTDFTKDLTGEFYVCGNMNMINEIRFQHPNARYESYFGG